MALSKNSRILLKALALLEMDIDDICVMFLLLETEPNIEKMIAWMCKNIDSNESEIKKAALRISSSATEEDALF
ncbi:MAG: hypothetical protein IJO92_03580 [Clostridia bacterium]|nr:hypothetical protein [Clostridia bacterium]